MTTTDLPRPGERHYGLDWLRIGAFGLLIFYHIGMFFAPGDWLVKAPRIVEAAAWPMLAMQPWRMPLLFAVSGYASYALLLRSGGAGAFLSARSKRLLLPLLFGLLFINPPQTWIALAGQHDYPFGLAHFWTQDWLRFGNIDGVQLPNEEHLWFIAYLWAYTMALGLAVEVAPAAVRRRAAAALASLEPNLRLLCVPLAAMLVLRVGILFLVPEERGILHDWVSDLTFVPAFLFGFSVAARPQLWPAVLRARWAAAAVSAAAYLLLLAIESRYPSGILERPHAVQALDRGAAVAMAWSMVLLLFGAAQQWLRRDHPLRARLAEMIFPFYLVHQAIIVVVGWTIRDWPVPQWGMFLILVAATIGGCWLFYEVSRRIAPLRPFVGLARARPKAAAAPAEPQPA